MGYVRSSGGSFNAMPAQRPGNGKEKQRCRNRSSICSFRDPERCFIICRTRSEKGGNCEGNVLHRRIMALNGMDPAGHQIIAEQKFKVCLFFFLLLTLKVSAVVYGPRYVNVWDIVKGGEENL